MTPSLWTGGTRLLRPLNRKHTALLPVVQSHICNKRCRHVLIRALKQSLSHTHRMGKQRILAEWKQKWSEIEGA